MSWRNKLACYSGAVFAGDFASREVIGTDGLAAVIPESGVLAIGLFAGYVAFDLAFTVGEVVSDRRDEDDGDSE